MPHKRQNVLPSSNSRPDKVQPSDTTMLKEAYSRSQFRGNQCNMSDVMRRISLSKPPVNMSMYQTLYMMDYKPYSDNPQQSPTSAMGHKEKQALEAQLKAKEFAQPIEYEPVKYAENPDCQEVQPPYPARLEMRLGKDQDVSPPFQHAKEDLRKDFHAVLPSTKKHLLQDSPPVEPVVTQDKEAERLSQQTDPCAVPVQQFSDNTDDYCIKNELGRNWDDYQQFVLETRRASQAQAQGIKGLSLGCSVFPEDFIGGTDASTYQRDYKHWPRIHSGFCRAHRNFSNLLFEDGYHNEKPWMSEYMDNYGIFLQKMSWKSWHPVSSVCATIKSVPHLTHGMPSQTPVTL